MEVEWVAAEGRLVVLDLYGRDIGQANFLLLDGGGLFDLDLEGGFSVVVDGDFFVGVRQGRRSGWRQERPRQHHGRCERERRLRPRPD